MEGGPTSDQIAEDDSFLHSCAKRFASPFCEADDVCQEIWKQILETRPKRGPGFRSWLRLAARHAALREISRNRNRVRREARQEKSLHAESAEQVAARNSLAEWIHSLVDGLPSPYREVIRMRFLEELSSTVIAERLQCSDAVVRVQIQRGLRMLKARTKERESPWFSLALPPALLAFLRPLRNWRVPALGAVSGILVLAVVSILESYDLGRSDSLRPPAVLEGTSSRDFAPTAPPSVSRVPASVGTPSVGTLHLELQEIDGTPAMEMRVLLERRASGGAPVLRHARQTDARGELTMEIAAGTWTIHPMRGGSFDVEVPGGLHRRHVARVPAGVPVLVGAYAGPAGRLWVSYPDLPDMGHFTFSTRKPEFPVTLIDPRSWIGIRQGLRAMTGILRVDSLSLDEDGIRTASFPSARKARRIDGVVVDHRGEPVRDAWVRVVDRRDREPTSSREGRLWRPATSSSFTDEEGAFRVHKGFDQFSRVIVSTADLHHYETRSKEGRHLPENLMVRLPECGTRRGTVRTAEGGPAARARVTCLASEWSAPVTVHTSDTGEFVLEGLAPGPVELVAVSEDGRERCHSHREVSASQLDRLDLKLEPDKRIGGRVVAKHGAPLVGVRVHLAPLLVGEDGDLLRPLPRFHPAFSTATDDEGRFQLTGLKDEPHTLWVTTRGGASLWSVEGIYPGTQETPIRLGATGAIHGRLTLPRGWPAARLFLDSPLLLRRSPVVPEPITGVFDCTSLQPGMYRLLVEGAEGGYAVLHDMVIEPHSTYDLGTVRIPEPASLRIDIPAHIPGYFTTVSISYEDGPWPQEQQLTLLPGQHTVVENMFPGSYLVEVNHAQMTTWRTRLTLTAGATVAVEPEYRAGCMILIALPGELAARGLTTMNLRVDGDGYMNESIDLSHTFTIQATLEPGPHRLDLALGDFWRSEFDVVVPAPRSLPRKVYRPVATTRE